MCVCVCGGGGGGDRSLNDQTDQLLLQNPLSYKFVTLVFIYWTHFRCISGKYIYKGLLHLFFQQAVEYKICFSLKFGRFPGGKCRIAMMRSLMHENGTFVKSYIRKLKS